MSTRKGGAGNTCIDVAAQSEQAACHAETHFHLISNSESARDVALRYDASKVHVLVTGGSGYLGTHTCLVLLEKGYEVTVIDNLANSKLEGLRRVAKLTGMGRYLHFKRLNVSDVVSLSEFLEVIPECSACYHLAALKAVGQSCQLPLEYYDNNVGGTVRLLQILHEHNCRRFIFSSSATVYGTSVAPVTEESPVGVGIANPYGRSKYIVEEVLRDFSKSEMGKEWAIMILRYFNPVGAHESGLIGEDPSGIPNNLMPYVLQVAIGRRKELTIFGDDYPTPDGTGVRDYIHVMDLADGHQKSLQYMDRKGTGLYAFNLGSGRGFSVLEMVNALQKVSGVPIPYSVGERREGDLAEVYADASAAKRELGWSVSRGLETMCKDMWRWQQCNPQGFNKAEEEAVAASLAGPAKGPRLSTGGIARRMSLAAIFVR
mmetsp:Transcript_103324/g.296894  ORF Transcript_103324/g.296894 Transcript_103324/m.296894 type:complete len:431 (-) Transcript_103324:205-1497(-)